MKIEIEYYGITDSTVIAFRIVIHGLILRWRSLDLLQPKNQNERMGVYLQRMTT